MTRRDKREKLKKKINNGKSEGGNKGLKQRLEAIEEYLNLDT